MSTRSRCLGPSRRLPLKEDARLFRESLVVRRCRIPTRLAMRRVGNGTVQTSEGRRARAVVVPPPGQTELKGRFAPTNEMTRPRVMYSARKRLMGAGHGRIPGQTGRIRHNPLLAAAGRALTSAQRGRAHAFASFCRMNRVDRTDRGVRLIMFVRPLARVKARTETAW